jgi:vancomycin resistance protein VanJ
MNTEADGAEARSPLARLLRVLTLACCVVSSAIVLAAALLIYAIGEHWWPTSLLLFGPTWLLQLVLAGSAAAWLLFHRGIVLGVVLALSELVLLLPVQGYQPPWPAASASPSEPSVRLVTWNVGGRLNYANIVRLFSEYKADIVVLQECSGLPKDSLPTELAQLNTHECYGMCMLSKIPVTQVEDRDRKAVWDVGGSGAIVRYTFGGATGPFTLTNVHLETPREGFEDFIDHGLGRGIATLSAKNAQRYTEARLAFEWSEREPTLPRLVAGDFNTPPQSDMLRHTWQNFSNCFGVTGSGFGHTKVSRWLGVRIDHVLASHPWSCVNTELLTGFDSDHRPLLAVVALPEH